MTVNLNYSFIDQRKHTLKCTINYENDMGHYMPRFQWKSIVNEQTKTDLETRLLPIIGKETNDNVEIYYEKIPNTKYSARFFKPRIQKKNIKTTIGGFDIDIDIFWK